jgi:hypothetical protein
MCQRFRMLFASLSRAAEALLRCLRMRKVEIVCNGYSRSGASHGNRILAVFPTIGFMLFSPCLNLRTAGHTIYRRFTGNAPLDEATPSALTFLLAFAAKSQGARVITFDEQSKPQLALFIPSRGNN